MGKKKRFELLKIYFQRASRFKPLPIQIIDVLIHRLRSNTHPFDYYAYHFYENGKTWKEKERYTSVSYSKYWPYETNLLKYNILFSDKYISKYLFKGLDIPTAKILGTIGWNMEVGNFKDFEILIKKAPSVFVMKLISGASGNGFIKIKKQNDHLVSIDKSITVNELWERIQPHLERGYIVEEALINPPHIAILNPSSLNSFRVITFKGKNNTWKVIQRYLKVGRNGAEVDNSNQGGLILTMDRNGITGPGYDMIHDRYHDDHPDNGKKLKGIKIPEIFEAEKLALKISKKFNFLGTIGWDIAPTEVGPKVLEGNLLWGPDNIQITSGPIINDEMAEMLPRRHILSRYQKDRMYPGFYDKKSLRNFLLRFLLK